MKAVGERLTDRADFGPGAARRGRFEILDIALGDFALLGSQRLAQCLELGRE